MNVSDNRYRFPLSNYPNDPKSVMLEFFGFTMNVGYDADTETRLQQSTGQKRLMDLGAAGEFDARITGQYRPDGRSDKTEV